MDWVTCGLIHNMYFDVCNVVYWGAIKSILGEVNASLLNCYPLFLKKKKDKYEQDGVLHLHIHQWLV